MEIEIHGFNVVVHGMTQEDEEELCDEVLGISFDLLKASRFGNAVKLTHSFGKAKESVYIRTNRSGGNSYSIINLKGSFFDHSPYFSFEKLLAFLSRFKYTFKQIDIAFNDNNKHLTKKDLLYWCRYSDDYCVGSLVERSAPINLYQ